MAGRHTRHTRAIVLDRTKLGEQDLILTLLSEDGDQIRAVAKGARKPGGRLAARVELFCETDLLIASGRSLGIVSEASLVCAHVGLRGEYERVCAASAICELARLTCFEDACDSFLYSICARALGACEEAKDSAHLDLVVAAYTMKVLAHSGWRPELGSCCSCGDKDTAFFSSTAGGVLCSSCATDLEGAILVTPVIIDWLKALIALTFDKLLHAVIDDATAHFLVVLAHSWATTHLEARLRAFEFIVGL